jgi:hypothetical protein
LSFTSSRPNHAASDASVLQQQGSGSNAAPGVLRQWDMNAAGAAAAAAAPSAAGKQVHATVTGACGIPATAAAVAAAEGDEPVKVFKGRLSGAAAAIRAVQQQQEAHTNMQQQQQCSSRVFSLAGGPTPQQQQQQQQQRAGGDGSSELLVVPFEFKTGKDYFSHKAQVGSKESLCLTRWHVPSFFCCRPKIAATAHHNTF